MRPQAAAALGRVIILLCFSRAAFPGGALSAEARFCCSRDPDREQRQIAPAANRGSLVSFSSHIENEIRNTRISIVRLVAVRKRRSSATETDSSVTG